MQLPPAGRLRANVLLVLLVHGETVAADERRNDRFHKLCRQLRQVS